MESLLVYTLKSAFVLTLLYLPYTLMLRQERFFRLNRMTLLTVLLLALVQPLCRITTPERISQTTVIADAQELVWQTEAIIVGNTLGAETAPTWGWQEWLTLVYIVGMVIVLCLRFCQLVQIRKVMRRGCLWRQREDDGVTVYCHVGDGAPFSWMRSIYISENDEKQNGRAILLHERAHIHCHHSLDILLLTLVEAVQWWNPLVYILGRSLRDVHEYEADNHVLHQGISRPAYQTLLIRKTLTDTSYAFANNFNRSHIMKRIDMMNRPLSNPWLRAKVIYVVPLLLFTLIISATPAMEPLFFIDGEEVDNNRVSQLPKDSISYVTVFKGESATSIYGERGKHGAVEIATKAKKKETKEADSPINDTVFETADEMPEFVGGETALKEYLSRHLTYPSKILDYGIQGRLDVSFVIERDGSITNVSAALNNETGSGADATITGFRRGDKLQPNGEIVAELMHSWKSSAEQLVKDMPHWKPARQDGHVVRARVCLPLQYRLQ